MYYFIVDPNVQKGRGEQVWKKLEHQLLAAGVEYQLRLAGEQGEAQKVAHELTEGCKEEIVIVAVGGDHFVNEILNGISFGCQISFGYILTDSDNNFARSLRLSGNPRRRLKKILNPKHYRYLDYGILTYGSQEPVYRRFAVSCGIGMDTVLCQPAQKLCSRIKKKLYFLCAKPAKGYLLLDGVKKVEFNNIYFVSCHIQPFEGGFLFAPKADPSDGFLEVCVAHHASKRKLFQTLLAASLRRAKKQRGIHFYKCREVQIHLDRPMGVHADGGYCREHSDIHVRCVERKLRMLM